MTQFSIQQDSSFPYVLLYSTFGTILSSSCNLDCDGSFLSADGGLRTKQNSDNFP